MTAAQAPSASAGEVALLAVRDLRGLPLATTVRGEVDGETGGRLFAWTFSRAGYRDLRAAGVPTFNGAELELTAQAAAVGRVRPETFRGWVERKRRRPEWRLTRAAAGLVLAADLGPITVGALAWELGVRLVSATAERKGKA